MSKLDEMRALGPPGIGRQFASQPKPAVRHEIRMGRHEIMDERHETPMEDHVRGVGRPKTHGSAADRARAYRARKKAKEE